MVVKPFCLTGKAHLEGRHAYLNAQHVLIALRVVFSALMLLIRSYYEVSLDSCITLRLIISRSNNNTKTRIREGLEHKLYLRSSKNSILYIRVTI